MRKEFIACACRKTAWRRAPWACAVVKAYGGFWAFESWDDVAVYKGQR